MTTEIAFTCHSVLTTMNFWVHAFSYSVFCISLYY